MKKLAMRSTTKDISLSILIVNYNGSHFLNDCFRSIATYVSVPHEIIVLDNCSKDGSAEFIRTRFPYVQLIENTKNVGFAAGNNIAASVAKGQHLMLLNNDTKLTSDIGPALQQLTNVDVGVVGVLLHYQDGRLQHSIGYEHNPLRIVLSWCGLGKFRIAPDIFRRQAMRDELYTTSRYDIDWVSGACIFTKREIWKRLQGMDEVFFMYVEDVDYCRRVRELGFRVAYVPNVNVVHYEGSGKPWIGKPALLRTVRSYCIYVKKYYGHTAELFVRSALATVMLFRSIAFLLRFSFSRDSLTKEKYISYFRVAGELMISNPGNTEHGC